MESYDSRRLRFWACVTGIPLLAYAALLAVPGDPPGIDDLFQRILQTLVPALATLGCFARARTSTRERSAWMLIALALAAWTLGNAYYSIVLWTAESVPFPSPADAGYLIFYMPAYAGFVALVRKRVRVTDSMLWIDGLIGTLAASATAAALVFSAVLQSTGGSTSVVFTNLAYPIADLVLLGLVVGALNAAGSRRNLSWSALVVGLAVFAIADSIYLYQASAGSYHPGTILDLGWPAAFVFITLSAWLPAVRLERGQNYNDTSAVRPIVFSLVALGLLVYDHFNSTNSLALVLAASCLLAALVRLERTLAAHRDLMKEMRRDAVTDALTGLWNRRKLMVDLTRRFESGGSPFVIASFDLDGFKAYNDTFGHPAGDALLMRVSRKLLEAVHPRGSAYRIGGDEFVVLVDAGDEGCKTVRAAARALHESGEGFAIGCSYGTLRVPDEAGSVEHALREVDERMYGAKQRGRASARNQTADVLITALRERHPELDPHLSHVAGLAVEIGSELGMDDDQLEELRIAAELHDIGKVAIPDTILSKPAALDAYEREYIERHSAIGERIVASAPALAPLAPIVRSVHERIDGTGYPDRIAGEEIPLASRVIAVADALDAMLEARPYAPARELGDALRELRRCAGSQFDPLVVAALQEVLVTRGTMQLMAPAVWPSGPAGSLKAWPAQAS